MPAKIYRYCPSYSRDVKKVPVTSFMRCFFFNFLNLLRLEFTSVASCLSAAVCKGLRMEYEKL